MVKQTFSHCFSIICLFNTKIRFFKFEEPVFSDNVLFKPLGPYKLKTLFPQTAG